MSTDQKSRKLAISGRFCKAESITESYTSHYRLHNESTSIGTTFTILVICCPSFNALCKSRYFAPMFDMSAQKIRALTLLVSGTLAMYLLPCLKSDIEIVYTRDYTLTGEIQELPLGQFSRLSYIFENFAQTV